MNPSLQLNRHKILILVTLSALSILLGAVVALWQTYGSDIFVAMLQTGLSWCF